MKVNYISVSFNTNNFLIDYMNKSLILLLLQSSNHLTNIFYTRFSQNTIFKKSYPSFVLCHYLEANTGSSENDIDISGVSRPLQHYINKQK